MYLLPLQKASSSPRNLVRSRTFRRNKIRAGHFSATKSAQVKLGAGQNRRRSKSLHLSVNHSHTLKVTILHSTSIKKNQHQLKIKILSDLVDCLLRYQCPIAIKYCISVIATHRSPAAFTRSLVFVSCKNGCVTINKAATCYSSSSSNFIILAYTNKQHIISQHKVQNVTTNMHTLWMMRKSNAHQVSNTHS